MSRPVDKSVDEDMIIPGVPPRATPIIEESLGGDTIFVKPLDVKDPERLRLLPARSILIASHRPSDRRIG
jgi:hypothetical protein